MFIMEKKMSAKFPIGIDCSNRLDGESITSFGVEATDLNAIDPNSASLNNNIITVWLNKNTEEKSFYVKFNFVTSTGKEFVESVKVNVVSDYS